MTAPLPCPACREDNAVIVRHCPKDHPTCTWRVCSRCRTLFDATRSTDGAPRHGHPTERVERACLLCHP